MHAVVQQELRRTDDTHEAGVDISGRLMALGAATDLLTASSWHSASLRPLAERSLALHEQPGHCIHIEGPDVRLHPQVGLARSLALRELGTNAIRHGALSNEAGGMELRWRINEEMNEGDRFHPEGSEHGGPQVQIPERTGDGAILIERSRHSSCQGRAQLEWRPAGLRFVLDAELARVGQLEPG